jgi:predicted aspartyl protease
VFGGTFIRCGDRWCIAASGVVFLAALLSMGTQAAALAGAVATQRDRHGRVLAPVFINGQGPFSLVVDTGANGSAISPDVAAALALEPGRFPEVLLHGVVGSPKRQAVRVESIAVGDATLSNASLPIVIEALDGADGFLGTGAFSDKRVLLDFRQGNIKVSDARPSSEARGFIGVPADLSRAQLVTVDARVNGIRVKAVLDTGAGGTIGNLAMRNLLPSAPSARTRDQIVGVTDEILSGETRSVPPIVLGTMQIVGARVSFADVAIFDYLRWSDRPALLLGMDVLGRFDSMIIDYKAGTLKLRPAT